MADDKFSWQPDDIQWVDESSGKPPKQPVSMAKLKAINAKDESKKEKG